MLASELVHWPSDLVHWPSELVHWQLTYVVRIAQTLGPQTNMETTLTRRPSLVLIGALCAAPRRQLSFHKGFVMELITCSIKGTVYTHEEGLDTHAHSYTNFFLPLLLLIIYHSLIPSILSYFSMQDEEATAESSEA